MTTPEAVIHGMEELLKTAPLEQGTPYATRWFLRRNEILEWSHVLPNKLETFLMTDQPPTCPMCGARVRIIAGAETSVQLVLCLGCSFQYYLEAE